MDRQKKRKKDKEIIVLCLCKNNTYLILWVLKLHIFNEHTKDLKDSNKCSLEIRLLIGFWGKYFNTFF